MSKKLLVVEDSRPIATVIKQIVESLGFEVTIAQTLAETETILQKSNDFFAATIDYALPDAPDGEAIKTVLSHGIPGLVLTGKMDDETRTKILAQPVIDYIPKENSQAFLYLKRILHSQITNNKIGILVVDDSLSARKHVAELLKRRNFTVYTAENGEEALALVKEHKNIKMVISDLEMPVMDGIKLTIELRKKYGRDRLTIIGISGTTSGVHSARFIKNGADDFLRKPFCPEEFYCRVVQNIENLNNIEQIKHAANTDYLTDLPNRRAFFREAEARLNYFKKNNMVACLAMMDLDNFKKINDNYGHDAGDYILKVFALYLRKHFPSGLLSRLGGEEFAVLLTGVDDDQLHVKLDDFRRDISVSSFQYHEQDLSFTVSIGVSSTENDSSLNELMQLSDKALYFAKENGRNQICHSGEEGDH